MVAPHETSRIARRRLSVIDGCGTRAQAVTRRSSSGFPRLPVLPVFRSSGLSRLCRRPAAGRRGCARSSSRGGSRRTSRTTRRRPAASWSRAAACARCPDRRTAARRPARGRRRRSGPMTASPSRSSSSGTSVERRSRSSGSRSRSPSVAWPAASHAWSAGASARVRRTFHSGCSRCPHRTRMRSIIRAAHSSPRRRHLLQEPPQQRRAQLGVDLVRDDLAGHQQRGRAPSPRTAARSPAGSAGRRRTGRGCGRRAAAISERFVVSLSVPATKPTASSIPTRAMTPGSEASPTTRSSCGSSSGPVTGPGSMTVTSRPSARRSAVSSRPKRP